MGMNPRQIRKTDWDTNLEDGSAATENILLAARAHGLG
jgi:nitroreductase